MSSLGYRDLCIVIDFLVLWSISLSSSLLHFKNGLEYLKRKTGQGYIPLKRLLVQSMVLRSFLVFLELLFFISISLIVSTSNIPKYLQF